TDQQGPVLAVEVHAGHRVRQRLRDRLRDREGLLRLVLQFHVPGDPGIGLDPVGGLVAELPADAADQRVERLLRVGQRAGQGRVAFGKAVYLDLLRQQRHHRTMAERALAEVEASAAAQAHVGAVGRAAVHAGGLAELHFAVDVVVEPAVADLAVGPQVAGPPADVTAQAGIGLVEAAAAQAPVHRLGAVAGERAVDDIAAGPVDADGQGRAHAVVQVALGVALRITAHVGPPAHTLALRRQRQARVHAAGAGAADDRFGVRQDRHLPRTLEIGRAHV